MKKALLILLICVVLALSACGVKQEAIEEKNSDSMAELTEIYDNLEDDEAKAVVKKMIDAPAEIECTSIEINRIDDAVNEYNKEVAVVDGYCGSALMERGEYHKYYNSYSELDGSGDIRMHYLTVYIEIQDNAIKQPMHVYANHRVMEKCAGIAPENVPVWNNVFYQVGGPPDCEPVFGS